MGLQLRSAAKCREGKDVGWEKMGERVEFVMQVSTE